MKQIIFLFCLAALFACNSSKKISTSQKTTIDSTATKTSVSESKTQKDSAAENLAVTQTEKDQSSAYKKKTTVKEYFSDEFDMDPAPSDTLAKADTARKAAGLKYRETIIEEEGNALSKESQVRTEAGKANKTSTEENKAREDAKTDLSKKQSEGNSSRANLTLLPWWALLIVGVVAAVFVALLLMASRR